MLKYDLKTGKFLNEAEPAASELDYNGQATEAFYDRMFSDAPSGEQQLRALSAVWACVYVISSAMGLMPYRLYRRSGDGQSTKEETKHRLAGLLQDSPDDSRSWQEFREDAMVQTLYRGNSYSQNFWRRGYLDSVFLWDENTIKAERLMNSRRVVYQVAANDYGIAAGNYFRPDVSHFKGIKGSGIHGISPITHCKNALRAAAAQANFQLKTSEKGGSIRGIMTGAPNFRNKEQANEVRQRWGEAFQKAQGDSGIPIFEGDMKFHSVSMTNSDAQFLETTRFTIEDVARIFNLPPHQIQHLERATNNNIDLLNQEYYKSSLLPWKLRLEAQPNRDWLTPADRRAGLFIACDPDEFLRADLAKWTDAMAKQIAGGVRSPNEARAKANLPPVEHGDILRVPANTVPVGYDPREVVGTSSQPPEN